MFHSYYLFLPDTISPVAMMEYSLFRQLLLLYCLQILHCYFTHRFHTREVNINLLISKTAFFSYCPPSLFKSEKKMVLLRLFDSKPNAYKFKIHVFIFWNFIDKITFSFSTWIYLIINKFIILEIIPFIPTTRYFYAI